MRRFAAWWVLAAALLLSLTACTSQSEQDMFDQAKAYQEAGDFRQAIETYRQIVAKYPEGDRSDEAQFMIGFLYANELQEIDKAKEAYGVFLDRYSETADSGMVMSAKWEVANLGRDISEIEELQSLMESSADTATAAQK
ncbi:tetratricopeptide repeat protein [bacterium]|nr:tetratricopeptide repeat protein [bacterium]